MRIRRRDQARPRNSLPNQTLLPMLRRTSRPTSLVERQVRTVKPGSSNLNHKHSPKLLARQLPRHRLSPQRRRHQVQHRNPLKSSLELSSTHIHHQSTRPSRLQQPPVYRQLAHQPKSAHRKRPLQSLVRLDRSPTKPPSVSQTSAARRQAPSQGQHPSRAPRKVQVALLSAHQVLWALWYLQQQDTPTRIPRHNSHSLLPRTQSSPSRSNCPRRRLHPLSLCRSALVESPQVDQRTQVAAA